MVDLTTTPPTTKFWVWAIDHDDALVRLYDCGEYETFDEAMRKRKLSMTLFKVEIQEVTL